VLRKCKACLARAGLGKANIALNAEDTAAIPAGIAGIQIAGMPRSLAVHEAWVQATHAGTRENRLIQQHSLPTGEG